MYSVAYLNWDLLGEIYCVEAITDLIYDFRWMNKLLHNLRAVWMNTFNFQILLCINMLTYVIISFINVS